MIHFLATPTLCDFFHGATVTALTPADVALEVRPIDPSKHMIQRSWFVVHYAMLLTVKLLDTTMTSLRVLINFMIIIHELMSDQQKSRPYTTVHYSTLQYTTVHAVSVKSLSVSVM